MEILMEDSDEISSSSSDSSGDGRVVAYLFESDSDDAEDDETNHRTGSTAGRRNKDRDFEASYQRLLQQYFVANATYSENDFVRRFRMKKVLFNRVLNDVMNADIGFQYKKNCAGKYGIHPLNKVAACLRILGYAKAFDEVDEIFGAAETTVANYFHRFCELVPKIYPQFLSIPDEAYFRKVMEVNATRGFPGMIGSIDCTVIKWQNCPMAHKASFCGPKTKIPTIQLEACCDGDLYIWHAFFGTPGASNDINVLDLSPLMHKVHSGQFPPRIPYVIDGKEYDRPYMLADGIYPRWPLFVLPLQQPVTASECAYTKKQESVRKDIERAFGALKVRFACLQNPCKFWTISKIKNMVETCIVFHNMIIHTRNQDYLFNETPSDMETQGGENINTNEDDCSNVWFQDTEKHFELRQGLLNTINNF